MAWVAGLGPALVALPPAFPEGVPLATTCGGRAQPGHRLEGAFSVPQEYKALETRLTLYKALKIPLAEMVRQIQILCN